MYVSKEKNIITYTISEGKNYIFDINSLIFYGLSGKPLKRLPSEVKAYTNSESLIIRMARYMFDSVSPTEFTSWQKRIVLADKLTSMGYTSKDLNEHTVCAYANAINNSYLGVVLTEKVILNFVKERIENNLPTDIGYLYEILREEQFSKIIKIEISEKDKAVIRNLVDDFSTEQLKLIAHWLVRGFGWFYNYNEYDIKRKLRDFFDRAKWLEYQPTKDDVLKQMVVVNKNYELRKTEIDNKRLAENQTRVNLNFENDEFIIIVPTTKEEFEFEGNSQHNCVFTSYLNSVINDRTNVVFVRKKSDIEHSYITCEVTKRGRINQYLGKCNSWVTEASAVEFEKQYQAYLNTIFCH